MLAYLQSLRHLAHLQHSAGAHTIRGIGGISAEDPDSAGVRLNETEQELHCCCLACPIRPKKRDHLTCIYCEIYTAQGANFSIVFADTFQTCDNRA